MAANEGLGALVGIERDRLLNTDASSTNIVFIGDKGVGKSSLLNSCATAVSQRSYREITRVGMNQEGQTITQYVQRFGRCGAERRKDIFQGGRETELFDELGNLANLIDVAGFPDESSPAYQEVLRAILFGRIQDGDSLREALNHAGDNPTDRRRILDLFPVEKGNEDMKSHRVVFVASAITDFPERLANLVNTVATPGGDELTNKREVHVFLVITKADLVTDFSEYESRKARMIDALGIRGSEDLKCFEIINYAATTAPDRFDRNYPHLDLPILKFLRRISDPSFQVVNPDFMMNDPDGNPTTRRLKRTLKSISNQSTNHNLSMVGIAIFILLFLVFVWSGSNEVLYVALCVGLPAIYFMRQ